MTAGTRKTWDQALVGRLRARRRHRWPLAAGAAVIGVVVGLLPGVAHASFDPGGTKVGSAQLDIPDGPVGTVDFSVGGTMTVRGKSFVANDKVLIFECVRGESDLLHNCATLATALSDSSGDFSVDNVKALYRWVSPSGAKHSCQQEFETVTGPGSIDLCSIAAATYDTLLQEPTSMADHYLCFGGFDDGCTTNRDGSPTTTTTTPPPPPVPQWRPAAPMNVARRNLATTVGLDGRIYALGGTSTPYDGPSGNDVGPALNSAEVFDPCGKRVWTPIAPMTQARTQFAAATGPDGRIYAIGGRDSVNGLALATVEAYDPAHDTWSPAASLAVPRSDHSAATGRDGRIYVIGGMDGGTIAQIGGQGGPTNPIQLSNPAQLQTVEAYDVAINQWSQVAPSLSPHVTGGAATAPNGRIYAIALGDSDSTKNVGPQSPAANESYGPTAAGLPATWRPEPNPNPTDPGAFLAHPAVTAGPDGLIYALGGEEVLGGEPTRMAWTFDPVDQVWTPYPEAMTARRFWLGAAAGKDGRVYAIGGQDYNISGQGEDPVPPHASTESLNVGPNTCPNVRPQADFNGDHTSDYSVFRSGAWFVKDGTSTSYGAAGDIPVPGDYDGDGKTDVAIFRPSTGLWAIHPSGGGADVFVTYGVGSDVPVVADYDGDGKADIAIWRPDTSTWWIHRSSDGVDQAFTYGISTDVPVPADYDGDHKADIAMYRSGIWFVHRSSDGADTAMSYGAPGDIPVPANYDAPGINGDGYHEGDYVADFAVFRPSTGAWYLHHSYDGTDEAFTFGVAGDIPVVGDYGSPDSPAPDAVSDPAMYRGGQWYTELGTTAAWGTPSDVPLAIPYAIRRAYFS